jgi:hypothetical protein
MHSILGIHIVISLKQVGLEFGTKISFFNKSVLIRN